MVIPRPCCAGRRWPMRRWFPRHRRRRLWRLHRSHRLSLWRRRWLRRHRRPPPHRRHPPPLQCQRRRPWLKRSGRPKPNGARRQRPKPCVRRRVLMPCRPCSRRRARALLRRWRLRAQAQVLQTTSRKRRMPLRHLPHAQLRCGRPWPRKRRPEHRRSRLWRPLRLSAARRHRPLGWPHLPHHLHGRQPPQHQRQRQRRRLQRQPLQRRARPSPSQSNVSSWRLRPPLGPRRERRICRSRRLRRPLRHPAGWSPGSTGPRCGWRVCRARP